MPELLIPASHAVKSQSDLDFYQSILDTQYAMHEIDAGSYASLSEDIKLMRRKVKS